MSTSTDSTPRRKAYRVTKGRPDTVKKDDYRPFLGKLYRIRKRTDRAGLKQFVKKEMQWLAVPTSKERKGLSFLANAILNRIMEEHETFVWTFKGICRACEGISKRKVQEALVELESLGYKRRYTSGRAAAGLDNVGTEYEFTAIAGHWWDRETGQPEYDTNFFTTPQNSSEQNAGDNELVHKGTSSFINNDEIDHPKSFPEGRTSSSHRYDNSEESLTSTDPAIPPSASADLHESTDIPVDDSEESLTSTDPAIPPSASADLHESTDIPVDDSEESLTSTDPAIPPSASADLHESTDIPVDDSAIPNAESELVVTTMWGKNPKGALEWVRHSHLAEKFRQILGERHEWTHDAAKAFYRKFRRGAIRPADIYVMHRLGRDVIRQMDSAALGSLQMLATRWEKIIQAFTRVDDHRWKSELADMCRQTVRPTYVGGYDVEGRVAAVEALAATGERPTDLGLSLVNFAVALESGACEEYVEKTMQTYTVAEKVAACRWIPLAEMTVVITSGVLGDAEQTAAKVTYGRAIKAAALAEDAHYLSPQARLVTRDSMLWLADICRGALV